MRVITINNTRSQVILLKNNGTPFLLANLYLVTYKRNLSLKRLLYISTVLKRVTLYYEQQGENLELILLNGNYNYILLSISKFYNNYLSQYNLNDVAYQNHVVFIRDYFIWTLNRNLVRNYNNLEQNQSNQIYIFKLNNIFSVLHIGYKRKVQDFKDLDKEYVKQIISRFSDRKNTSPCNYRNYLIIKLFYETGIRIAELLNLKTFEIISSPNYSMIKILRSDTIVDKRADKANIKNIQSNRVIAISNELGLLLEIYIMKIRRITYASPNTKLNHPYLFTSQLGNPLSKSSIQLLFKKINDEFPYIKNQNMRVTPHSLRHTFAFTFIKHLIEEHDLNIDRAKDELRKICGWAASSTMPALINLILYKRILLLSHLSIS